VADNRVKRAKELLVCQRLEQSFLRFRSRSRNRSRLRFSLTLDRHPILGEPAPDPLHQLERVPRSFLWRHLRDPVRHRILVIAEAAGFRKGDDALLLRSLISEGRIHHETVESSQVGLNSRVIERKGPTGLLVTTTSQQLEVELETRMFSIPVDDSREQTNAILTARASRWSGNGTIATRDPTPWHELQTWLESGERRVVIPYAAEITAAIPPAAVRLRRDVDTLWALVASHALLHQAQRERDPKGQIIAALDDYAAVYVRTCRGFDG